MSASIPPKSSASRSSGLQQSEAPNSRSVGTERSVVNMGKPTQEAMRHYESRLVQQRVIDRAEQEIQAIKEVGTAAKKGVARPMIPGRKSSQEIIPTATALRANMDVVAESALRHGPLAWALANPARVAHEALPPAALSDVRGRIVAVANILAEIRTAALSPDRDSLNSKTARRSVATVTTHRAFELAVAASNKAAETAHVSSSPDINLIQQSATTISQRLQAEIRTTSEANLAKKERLLIVEVTANLETSFEMTSISQAKKIGQQISVLVESGLPAQTINLLANSSVVRNFLAKSKNDPAINYISWNADFPANHILNDGKTFEARCLELTCAGPDGKLKEQKVLGPWSINEYKFDRNNDEGRILIGSKGAKVMVLGAWPKHPNKNNPNAYYKSYCKDKLKAMGEL